MQIRIAYFWRGSVCAGRLHGAQRRAVDVLGRMGAEPRRCGGAVREVNAGERTSLSGRRGVMEYEDELGLDELGPVFVCAAGL